MSCIYDIYTISLIHQLNETAMTTTSNIAKGTTLVHKTEGISATVIAIAYVKQNACIQFEDGYVQMMDLSDIEENYNIK